MKWRADLVDYVKANFVFATNHPRAFAQELQERGFYSATTFVGDIERSVVRLTQAISANQPISIRYVLEYEI